MKKVPCLKFTLKQATRVLQWCDYHYNYEEKVEGKKATLAQNPDVPSTPEVKEMEMEIEPGGLDMGTETGPKVENKMMKPGSTKTKEQNLAEFDARCGFQLHFRSYHPVGEFSLKRGIFLCFVQG